MKNDRGILIGLILIGAFTLVFGFFRLKESIEGPFRLPKPETAQLTNEELHQILVKKDTDNDGLSDEEELFHFHTSIYLDDSDSDGYSDKEEVHAGSDPLNPDLTPLKKVAENKQEEVTISPKNTPENIKDPTPDEIREFLIKSGMPKETVDKIDDETLKKLYNETVKETGINPKEFAPAGLGSLDFSKILGKKSIATPELENLSAQEIRQLLLNSGADPSILSQIDDETLKTLVLQAIKESQK